MTDELVTIASRALDVSPAEIELDVRCFVDRQKNRIYDLYCGDRHLILKEYLRSSASAKGPKHEFETLVRLDSTGVAPRPVFYDPALGPYVFYEFMEGKHWARRTPTHKEMTLLCEAIAALHAIDTDDASYAYNHDTALSVSATVIRDGFSAYADWAARRFPAANDIAQYLLDSLVTVDYTMESLDGLEPVLGFCRGDPRFANIITMPDGRVGFVDWEDAGLQDCAFELAELMTHAYQEDIVSPAEWEAFTDYYVKIRSDVDPTFKQRLTGYRTICAFWWLATLLQIGMQRYREQRIYTWRINELEPNEKLNRYLARVQEANSQLGLAPYSSDLDAVFFPHREL